MLPQRAARRLASRASPVSKRGLADVASGSFQYQVGEAAGTKFASRDLQGPMTTLAVVSQAGTRFQPQPGFTEGLEKFAFKNTTKRSQLRIVREAELLGAELTPFHTRESLVLKAKFLRDDLPYFTELLAEVISNTKYTSHEYQEEVIPTIHMAQLQQLGSARDLALSSVHGIAFHRGLGTPLHPSSSTALEEYINAENLADFGSAAYAKPNIAVVANGADHKDLGKWVGQFFEDVRSSPFSGIPSLESPPSKYYGGEERISHNGASTMILGFSGSSSFAAPGNNFKPEYNVLAALLGGDSSIKWSRGFSILSQASAETGARVSTTNASYSDAGLLYIEMRGGAKGVAAAAKKVVEALKSLSNTIKEEDFMKAKALAKFKALEGGQNIDVGLELTGSGLINGGKPHQLDEIAQAIQGVKLEAVKKAAKAAIEGKASVSSVGDLFVLPWAEEMGLRV